METSRSSDHERDRRERPGGEQTASPRDEDVLAWEAIGDDLWLPRRVRGSFRGGALG
jgi:hypothetical protein